MNTTYTNSTNPSMAALRIQDIDHERIWVAWQEEADRYSGGKPRKMPYDPRFVSKWAKANDDTTWAPRAQAEACARLLPKPLGLGGVGVEFGPLAGGKVWLGGVDFDSCRDKVTGTIDEWAQAILAALDSYSEVSPSGTGVKTFFVVDFADVPPIRAAMGGKLGTTFKRGNGGAHPPGIEVYIGGRYFTMTNMMLIDSTLELRRMPRAVLLDLLASTGPAFQTAGGGFSQKDCVSSSARVFTGSGGTGRSELALKLAVKRVAAGDTDLAIYWALAADAGTAAWLAEKGVASGNREFKRTCAAARAFIAAQTDGHEFDCGPAL